MNKFRRVVAGAVSAALIGVVGISAVAPETAQAAGVVVNHGTLRAGEATPARDDED